VPPWTHVAALQAAGFISLHIPRAVLRLPWAEGSQAFGLQQPSAATEGQGRDQSGRLAPGEAAGVEGKPMISRSQLEGILTLRLAHGKASALDVELLDALLHELDGVGEDVRALILTGTGSIFSAGVDLFRLTQGGPDYVRNFLPLLCRFLRKLFSFPRPVVAAVNGHAIAGGCVITLACDARLMADGVGRIGLPELLVGVPFPTAALEVVRFAVPREKVQSLIYTGRTLSARDALAEGLIEEVVAPDALLSRAQELAQRLAQIPPSVFSLTKLSLRAEALERIDRTGERQDQAALQVWSAPQTHGHIREYLHRTLGK
jgi:enoyl-CoA hydratase